MRSYPEKENSSGSAVSEILRHRHTDKRTSCYFIIRIIINVKFLCIIILLEHTSLQASNGTYLKLFGGCFFLEIISFRRRIVLTHKIIINFPGPLKSFDVKENHIGPAVSEILWYKQTDKPSQCKTLTDLL